MAHTARLDTSRFQSRSGDPAECDNFVARKQVQKSFEHRQPGRLFCLVRHSITQHATPPIERMPGECIPKNKVFGLQSQLQQSTPDNCRRGLRKTMTALSRLARPSWLDPKANLLWFKTIDFVFSK